jgi:hypothetical protein
MKVEARLAAVGQLALAILLMCSASCVIGFDTTQSVSQTFDLNDREHVESWRVDLTGWNKRRGELLVVLLSDLESDAPTELCIVVSAKRRQGDQWVTMWEKEVTRPIAWFGGRHLIGSISKAGEFLFEVTVLTPDPRIEWGQLRILGSRDEVLEHAFFVW